MRVRILSVFLLISTSSLLFSSVICDPNHHHNHNDFPWQNILSSLGIGIEKQTEPSGDVTVGGKDHYTSESSVDIVKSETRDESEIPVVAQSGTRIENSYTTYEQREGLALGYKIGIPIASIVFFVLFWYCICKCCCACCKRERPGVVVMQSNTIQNQPPAPQLILQQPIIHQQAPPTYDAHQMWAQHPPPQGPPQWGQPPQGPPQWAPHPMGQQQHYSPNSGYENAGYNPENAPPPYNPGKY